MLDRERRATNATSNGNAFPIGQRMDAIIYTMVVAVFYAGIILIILLSNAHRFRHKSSKRKTRYRVRRKCIANNSCRTKLKKAKKNVVVHSNYAITVVETSDKYNNGPDIV